MDFKFTKKKEVEKTIKRDPNFNWDLENRVLQAESERKAWLFAKIAMLGFLLSIIILLFLMPLKTVVPYVIRVNQTTGTTDIIHMENFKISSKDEAITKYFVNKFIVARESYQYAQLENDFYITRELSLPTVFQDHSKLYKGQNNLQQKYKDSTEIKVLVQSIIDDINTKVATVRFTKKFIDTKNNFALIKEEHWIASVAYDFYPEIDVSEERRFINPLGFKVLDYRLNPEIREKQ